MNKLMRLSQLESGESAEIFKIDEETLKNKLKVYGIMETQSVTRLFDAPNDPSRAYAINGQTFYMKIAEASKILIAKKILDWDL